MNKKNIFLWTLYDFANSITTIVFFLYFSQWLVIDKGVPDFWYNMIFTASSVLLLVTAPVLGSVADKTGRQQTYLNWITVLMFISFLLVTVIALFFPQKVFLAVLFFVLANYFYQFSFVFYNALLRYIAPPEKWGRISGIGQVGNWVGQIIGLLITLPFASGAVYLVGEAGRAQTFLPATMIFFILALPMLLFFVLPKQQAVGSKVSLKEEYTNYWSQFRGLVSSPGMGYFLLAYFFFNDAILTASNNFPIYLQKVFNVSDGTKSMLLLGILATAAVGAFCTGWVADRVGLKRTLMVVLSSYIIIFPALGLASNFTLFVIFTVLMGFMYGSTWAVTRAVMTALCPKEKLNFGFSFYTLAERVSTLVGPLSWGLVTALFVGLGPTRYRVAITAMAVFVAIGIFFLRKIEIPEQGNVVL
ncbi:MAG TPA: MFS transporter [Candidatus Paceibacterota bacterium]|nr:MFS transporter [Candidatus Paceibacterota bacterium]